MPSFFKACAMTLIGIALTVYSVMANASTANELSAEQAAADVRVLTRTLSALHPALTKYRTQIEIDAAFAKFETQGKTARTASI